MFPSGFSNQPLNPGQTQQPNDPFGPIPGSQVSTHYKVELVTRTVNEIEHITPCECCVGSPRNGWHVPVIVSIAE